MIIASATYKKCSVTLRLDPAGGVVVRMNVCLDDLSPSKEKIFFFPQVLMLCPEKL